MTLGVPAKTHGAAEVVGAFEVLEHDAVVFDLLDLFCCDPFVSIAIVSIDGFVVGKRSKRPQHCRFYVEVWLTICELWGMFSQVVYQLVVEA